jgi:hypothetical protein
MASFRHYRIIDDSKSFYLTKGKRKYYVNLIEVERPDWDYRVVVYAEGKDAIVITSDPLCENDFVGKKLSTILKKYISFEYSIVMCRTTTGSNNPCAEISLGQFEACVLTDEPFNPKKTKSKSTTNRNLLLIL